MNELKRIILLPYHDDRKLALDNWIKKNYREILVEVSPDRYRGYVDPVTRIELAYALLDQVEIVDDNKIFRIELGVINDL